MGFYIRKALRVGPFRFNLSKSGIGISAGVKGLRFGTGPRGNYVHMGRGGLYFRKSLNAPRARSPRNVIEPRQLPGDPANTVGPMEDIDSSSVLEMVDASSAELLQELNEKRRKTAFLPIVIGIAVIILLVFLASHVPTWLALTYISLSLVLCWFVWTKDLLRKTTVIIYKLEPDVEHVYGLLHDAFAKLFSCSRTWHVNARGEVLDRKYHAGASAVIKRKTITLKNGHPPFIKTNIEVPLVPVGRQVLAFLPDRLLVFESSAVGAIGYQDLVLDIMESRFIEDEGVPQDATVVGKTWRYVNKDGGPDRRFKNNHELPICAYEQIHFSSKSGLNELIQMSRRGLGPPVSFPVK